MADFDSMQDDSQTQAPAAPSASPPSDQSAAPPQAPADFDSMQDDSDKYGTPGQQSITALEGAAQGIAGPLATLGETKLLGVDPADIRGREAANPLLHGAAETVGFVGSALTGVGEASVLAKIGEGAKVAAGLGELGEGASLAQKAAAGAVSQAAEFATMQAGDETSKMILQDPDTSAQTALGNIGLAAALGGATGGFMSGAVAPLWKATLGDKLDGALQSIAHDQRTGIAGAIPDQTMRPLFENTLAAMGGVKPEVIQDYLANHAAIQNVPEFDEVYSHAFDHVNNITENLEKSKSAYNDAKASMTQEFVEQGMDAKSAKQAADMSLRDAQTKLASDISQKALDSGSLVSQSVENLRQSVVDQSSKAYDLLENSDEKIPLKPFLAKGVGLAADLEAQGTLESKAQAGRLRKYLSEISEKYTPLPETSLEKYTRQGMGLGAAPNENPMILGSEAKTLIQGLDKVSKYDFNATAFDKGLSNNYKQLRYTLDDTLKSAVPEYRAAMKPLSEDTQLLSELKKYGTPEDAVSSIRSLKNEAKYKNEMPMLQKLEERTGMKFTQDIEPYANPSMRDSLEKSLPEYKNAQDAAAALQRMKSPEVKAAMQQALAESAQAKAMEAAQAAKDQLGGTSVANLQSRLKTVGTPGKNIAIESALAQFPELKGKSVTDIANLLRMNDAFTKNATRGSKHVNMYGALVGGLAGVAHAAGHMVGIPIGVITGGIVDNHGPEFVKMALDKYMSKFGNLNELTNETQKGAAKGLLGRILGSNMANPNSEAFKAGTDYISAIKKGVQMTKDAAEAVFKSGSTQVIKNLPTQQDRDKLDKTVSNFADKPNNQVQYMQQSKVGHYLPDHGESLAKSATAATTYLQQIKPKPYRPGVLDKEIQPSPMETARYNRALDIANNPLIVLQHAKDGTIQPSDIQDLHNMYPGLYQQYSQQVTAAIVRKQGDDEPIPYKTRVGTSLLLGQPLDSSMSPASIIAAQPVPTPPPQQQQPNGNSGNKSTSKLGKDNSSYQTTTQSAEADRTKRS